MTTKSHCTDPGPKLGGKLKSLVMSHPHPRGSLMALAPPGCTWLWVKSALLGGRETGQGFGLFSRTGPSIKVMNSGGAPGSWRACGLCFGFFSPPAWFWPLADRILAASPPGLFLLGAPPCRLSTPREAGRESSMLRNVFSDCQSPALWRKPGSGNSRGRRRDSGTCQHPGHELAFA